ncbi:hypothetical protein PLESTB_001548800 [Pleodorina starrii]|uniref:Uncharacterized protein n=1 Tax=Pleodorina starrii TaxID=330485 RepID=A0A9W6BX71_9CHLO|nr:hypothetical protein PLESTB_001548800 [Pleodorina starrii]
MINMRPPRFFCASPSLRSGRHICSTPDDTEQLLHCNPACSSGLDEAAAADGYDLLPRSMPAATRRFKGLLAASPATRSSSLDDAAQEAMGLLDNATDVEEQAFQRQQLGSRPVDAEIPCWCSDAPAAAAAALFDDLAAAPKQQQAQVRELIFSADPENDRMQARFTAHLAAAEEITYKPQQGRTGGSSSAASKDSGNSSSHHRGSFLKRLRASATSAAGGGSKQHTDAGSSSLLHRWEARSSNGVNGNSVSGDNIHNRGSGDDGRKGGKGDKGWLASLMARVSTKTRRRGGNTAGILMSDSSSEDELYAPTAVLLHEGRLGLDIPSEAPPLAPCDLLGLDSDCSL